MSEELKKDPIWGTTIQSFKIEISLAAERCIHSSVLSPIDAAKRLKYTFSITIIQDNTAG